MFVDRVGDVVSDHEDWALTCSRPCIVSFTAPFCDVCRKAEAVISNLMVDFIGRVDFYEVDLEAESLLDCALNVRRLPALLFCNPHTDIKATVSGASTEEDLRDLIKEYLLGNSRSRA